MNGICLSDFAELVKWWAVCLLWVKNFTKAVVDINYFFNFAFGNSRNACSFTLCKALPPFYKVDNDYRDCRHLSRFSPPWVTTIAMKQITSIV